MIIKLHRVKRINKVVSTKVLNTFKASRVFCILTIHRPYVKNQKSVIDIRYIATAFSLRQPNSARLRR